MATCRSQHRFSSAPTDSPETSSRHASILVSAFPRFASILFLVPVTKQVLDFSRQASQVSKKPLYSLAHLLSSISFPSHWTWTCLFTGSVWMHRIPSSPVVKRGPYLEDVFCFSFIISVIPYLHFLACSKMPGKCGEETTVKFVEIQKQRIRMSVGFI
jgi:hypothetical protein